MLAYQSEAQYLKYSPWTHRTAEEVQDFVRGFIEWQGERPRTKYQLAIMLRVEGRLIGNCGIRLESADSRQANIGYEIAPGYWGEGYASEAVRAMVAFGFAELRLHRIWARCVAENVAFLPGAGKGRDAKGGAPARGGVDERPMVGHTGVRHSRSRMDISCIT